ncbi:MAG TPA: metal-dependent transcriptional regulator [Ignavibacteria bacterium]|nr:metal-dependent transcriptional regulator [Ignavibacteria bacterium]
MNKSFEDYLKNIYSIQISSGKVTNTELSERLNISPAAISEMVSKLSKSDYIENNPYKGFKLTKKGEAIAINLVRKHRIWEVFLVEYLKYPWENVHNEAENLEHASSDELILRMENFLEYPKFDPHGHPIPDKNGKIIKENIVSLSELIVNDKAVIKQVSDESSEVLQYLSKIGLKLNDEIKVIEKINFDNSFQIHFRSGNIFLSEKLSKNIFVKKV